MHTPTPPVTAELLRQKIAELVARDPTSPAILALLREQGEILKAMAMTTTPAGGAGPATGRPSGDNGPGGNGPNGATTEAATFSPAVSIAIASAPFWLTGLYYLVTRR